MSDTASGAESVGLGRLARRPRVLPKTLSASSIKTWMACPSRFVAENIHRGANFQGDAALLGTTLHAALEDFIGGVKIHKTYMWEEDVLLELYDKYYKQLISPDINTEWYREGRAILIGWFNRPYMLEDIIGCKIISLEEKNFFEVPVLDRVANEIIKIRFNYIMDRFDDLGGGEIRVVDYKSQRQPLRAEDLRENIQAKVYALAALILYPNATRIWVDFDFLRHEKIGVVFTREDAKNTWQTLKQIAQDIMDTDEDDASEQLNPECTYCVRKPSCLKLRSNIDAGGVMGLDIDDLAEVMADIADKLKGLNQLKNEVEKRLLMHGEETDQIEWDAPVGRVKVGASGRRDMDFDKLSAILGPAIVAECKGRLTLSVVDDLILSGRLTPSQQAAVRGITKKKYGESYVRVTRRK
jgi:RecB family exonuclease